MRILPRPAAALALLRRLSPRDVTARLNGIVMLALVAISISTLAALHFSRPL